MSVGLGLQGGSGALPGKGMRRRVMESLWAEEESKAIVLEARGWDLEPPVRGREGRKGSWGL